MNKDTTKTINALRDTKEIEKEFKEFFSTLEKNRKRVHNAYKEMDKKRLERTKSRFMLKLPKLLHALTSVKKRKTIRKSYKLEKVIKYWGRDTVEVGINHNGLGVVHWGSQLRTLTSEYEISDGYSYNNDNFKMMIELFKDEELCLDIADNILSRNRKDFLKLSNLFRKYDFVIPEREIKAFFHDKLYVRIDMYDGDIEGIYAEMGEEEDDEVLLGQWDCYNFIRHDNMDSQELFKFRLYELIVAQNIFNSYADEIIKSFEKVGNENFQCSENEIKLNNEINNLALTYEALENI